jgi:maltooligosyltrehalose trehalohydrolase
MHAIVDASARPFLRELNNAVASSSSALKRQVHLIAECDRNDIRTVQPADKGGYGFAAQWNDDFHHAVHTALTKETHGYYEDFGKVSQIARSLRSGYVYQGEYSNFRLRSHGSDSTGVSGDHFVVFTQNHDQIGNRMNGERLAELVDFEALKVAASVMLVSPFLPLIFMGEEYGETAPFQYFVSHGDAELIEAVRRGRKSEFQAFRWDAEPPDPQDEATFWRSRLNWELQKEGRHRQLRDFYGELLRMRKRFRALGTGDMACIEAMPFEQEKALALRRWCNGEEIFAVANFSEKPARIEFSLPRRDRTRILNSREPRWGGPGSSLPECLPGTSNQELVLEPFSFALYRTEDRGSK